MRIILFKSVDNLGSAGDVVEVKKGYFRNFLGPRGFAKEANRQNLALMESRRKKIEAMVERERIAAGRSAEEINGTELEFELRSNDRGQLFGSVTTTDIAKALADKGFKVDRRKIELSEHIKSLGSYEVRVRLYPEVYAELKVHVKRLLTAEEAQMFAEEEERKAEEEARRAEEADEAAEAEEESPEEAAAVGGGAEEAPEAAEEEKPE